MLHLKRIKYVSEFAEHVTRNMIDKMVERAARQNEQKGITGILIASGRLFFQVIEGPAAEIDGLFEKILKDKRHHNVLLLNSEWGGKRIFPDWALKRVDVDDESIAEMEPLKAILTTIMENRMQIERLSGVLERSVWKRFSKFV